MLAQRLNGKHDQPVAYASRLLNPAERNYSTTDRKALAMIYAVKKFRHYLLGNRFRFIVDHHSLSYLVNQPLVTGRVARWIMILLEYDFEVVYVPGKRHIVADYLSRDTTATDDGIDDSFNDPYIQSATVTPEDTRDWRYPYVQYLTSGTLPTDVNESASYEAPCPIQLFRVIYTDKDLTGKHEYVSPETNKLKSWPNSMTAQPEVTKAQIRP